jgi:phosphate transport system permease protein
MNNTAKAQRSRLDIVKSGLGKRYRAEKRFRCYGMAAIIASIAFLALLFSDIIS